MSRIPMVIWAEKLARNVQTRPNTRGPQTEPRRLTRLESALAAPIVSLAPALMWRGVFGRGIVAENRLAPLYAPAKARRSSLDDDHPRELAPPTTHAATTP